MAKLNDEEETQGSHMDAPIVFFCLRADSDVDHIVPIIDALARRRDYAIRVVIYDPIKTYRDDYRFVYLRKSHGIEPEHILDLAAVSHRTRAISLLLRWLFLGLLHLQRRSPLAGVTRLLRPPLLKLQQALKSRCATQEAVNALASEVSKYRRGLVVFDHTINPLATAVTAAARRSGLATVALPHSVPHLCDLPRDAVVAPEAADGLDWGALYDRVVLPNSATAGRFAQECLDSSLLTTIGSARFSRGWGATLDTITPRFDWNPGGTKVLFILSKKGPYVDWQEVNRVSAQLCGDSRLAVAFKPHPRTEVSGLPAIASSPRVTIAPSDLPTASLVQWADLVVFWGSSVIYDAIRQKKPTLHLAYLFRLHFDFEPFMRSWQVDSFEEFCTRLDRFLGTGETTYSEAEARACMEALIEQEKAPVLEGYVQCIEGLLSHQLTPAPRRIDEENLAKPSVTAR